MPVLSNAEGNPTRPACPSGSGSASQPAGGEAQSASNQRPSAAKKLRRGGRRPGAGAPPGNLNALKHGRRSAQFAQLGALLASIPQARDALLGLARRHQLKQRRAEQVAALLLQRLIERAGQLGYARLNDQPPTDERRTIKVSPSNTGDAGYDGRARPADRIPRQSNPVSGATPSIGPQIG